MPMLPAVPLVWTERAQVSTVGFRDPPTNLQISARVALGLCYISQYLGECQLSRKWSTLAQTHVSLLRTEILTQALHNLTF